MSQRATGFCSLIIMGLHLGHVFFLKKNFGPRSKSYLAGYKRENSFLEADFLPFTKWELKPWPCEIVFLIHNKTKLWEGITLWHNNVFLPHRKRLKGVQISSLFSLGNFHSFTRPNQNTISSLRSKVFAMDNQSGQSCLKILRSLESQMYSTVVQHCGKDPNRWNQASWIESQMHVKKKRERMDIKTGLTQKKFYIPWR